MAENNSSEERKSSGGGYELVILVGNLGRDPEMRYTPSGQAVTNFSIAVSRSYTLSSGEQVSETKWFRITTWGKSAENCNKFLHKGSKVLVQGRLTGDNDTGGPKIFRRSDGTAGASFEITANTVQFLSQRNNNEPVMYDGPEATEDNIEIPF